ncbi:MAG: GNAT family N-acetyltransferase [Defluviitaleaceae bacterium]|nr:GNAT family N-acetyltransferase [Defluviitaleaceae bacterium]
MNFKVYNDVNDFYNATHNLLMQHEAQNLILLGNIIIGKEGKDKSGWRDPANWLMATVADGNDIQIVAMMTPPRNITLYAKENKINEAATACLISGLANTTVPGVISDKNMAQHFAQAYCAAKGLSSHTLMNQRIYELTEVNPSIPQTGQMRLANESDMHFLPYWLEAFNAAEEYGKQTMSIPQDAGNYLHKITQKQIYVLEDGGQPVSISGTTREIQTVCGIAYVYTPPYFRKKGYATSCVAQLSQMVLNRGFTKCVLYTDLANPISNSIYQKIGYRPVCDSLMLKFV